MRNWKTETENRVKWIQAALASAGANGVVFGNSGGKDSALVGILCKKACDNTVGLIMPCQSGRNYTVDKTDGEALAEKFGIECRVVDVTPIKNAVIDALPGVTAELALANVNPRVRMITLYAVAQQENRLVAGTGNRSEITMGYFTKWGDGACDFNPIADLTASEIFEFLKYLGAPESIITKAPSAGLWDGQTDEEEMGLTYAQLDRYILTGEADKDVKAKVDAANRRTAHKRRMPLWYGTDEIK